MFDNKDKKWFALYTKSRAEKKVKERFLQQNIACYLPTQKILKQWSDRKKWVDEPLFKSYIFVKIDYVNEYINVLSTDGVVNFVKIAGKPATIRDKEIENIVIALKNKPEIELVSSSFPKGTEVTVNFGAFKGISGEVVEHHGSNKLLIRIDTIGQAMLLELPASFVA